MERFQAEGDLRIWRNEGLEVAIPQELFTEETVQYAICLEKAYRDKVNEIAEFCVKDFNFRFFLGWLTQETVADKLKDGQRLLVNKDGGYVLFDPKEKGFGRLAIRFDGMYEHLVLEDECCEANSCKR